MKVTRLIREYVTKSITDAYAQKKNPYADLLEADKKKLKDFEAHLNEKIRKESCKFFEENDYVYYHYHNEVEHKFDGKEYRCYKPSNPHSKYEYLSDNWEQNMKMERNKKIDEVLLNLELGANRAELDEMLKSIVSEVMKNA